MQRSLPSIIFRKHKSGAGFTVIELLVVIGITVILALVVITTLNPVEILKQSRDAKRLSEIESVNSAIEFSLSQDLNLDIGDSNIIYLSLPDSDPACGSYTDLPSLDTAAGWSYSCSSLANYRNIDGMGWLPIDFTSLPTSPFTTLPMDPVNDAGRGLYYAYTTGGSWELNVQFESEKYSFGGGGDIDSTDGGDTIVLYEAGNDLDLMPAEVAARIMTDIKINTACSNGTVSGYLEENYSKWTIPGSKKVAITKILLWQPDTTLSASEFVEVAIYSDLAPFEKISESVLIQGTGSSGWVSSTLSVPIAVNLGQTYRFGIGPTGGSTFNLGVDVSPYCAGYPPSGVSYVDSFPDGSLNADADFSNLSASAFHFGIIGISYAE